MMLLILAFASVVASILWPSRCEDSPNAWIANTILIAVCGPIGAAKTLARLLVHLTDQRGTDAWHRALADKSRHILS